MAKVFGEEDFIDWWRFGLLMIKIAKIFIYITETNFGN